MDIRSSHRRCAIKEGVLKNFANVTGKYQCQSFYSKRDWHRCSPVNFVKILQNNSRQLLLKQQIIRFTQRTSEQPQHSIHFSRDDLNLERTNEEYTV